MKLAYVCMILTERSCGSRNACKSHQRVPERTRTVRARGSNRVTPAKLRMSRWTLPGLAVCPPMLKCPPPTDTGPVVRRSVILYFLDAGRPDDCPYRYRVQGSDVVTMIAVPVMRLLRRPDSRRRPVGIGAILVAARLATAETKDSKHPQQADQRHRQQKQPPCRSPDIMAALSHQAEQ